MSTTPVDAAAGAVEVGESPRPLRHLLRRPAALISIAYLALLVAVAVVAPLALPSVARQQAGDLTAFLQGPSWHHLLGTDELGRDVFKRLLVGAQPTMIGVAEAVVVMFALGVPAGLAAGYLQGWFDQASNWLANLAFSMPSIIIALVVLTVYPRNMLAAMVTVGVLGAPFLMRLVRSATLPIREELYIAAAQVSGLSRRYIIRRHVLPRIAGPVIVQTALLAGFALLAQIGLTFLGLLGSPPAPSWGGLISDGLTNIERQPWLIWPPGIAITLTVLAFGVLGDVVRDMTTEAWAAGGRRRSKRPVVQRAENRPAAEAASNEEPVLLRVNSLRVGFPSRFGIVTVVEDATFEVAAGETVGLVGESGCGKTTTAMSILGLLPANGHVLGGEIIFAGRDIAAAPERELRKLRGREIGLVSQEPMVSFNPVFRIGWQVEQLLRIHQGLSAGAARAAAIDLLERVHLPDPESVAHRYPHELSGGMAQRVAIARALAGNPKLLIADEPTTALDVTIQAEILDLLRDLQRDREMAVLLVTHDWGVVADACDRVVVMYAGQIVERGDVSPIFANPRHPYTEALLASNPYNADGVNPLRVIPGLVPKPGAWPQGCHFHPRCNYATRACLEAPVQLARLGHRSETRCIHYDQIAQAG